MFYTRMRIDRTMPFAENACQCLLPFDPNQPGIKIQTLKCNSRGVGEGYSLMRIVTEGGIEIPTGITSGENGECSIEKISSNHYTAIITNRNCYICSLFSAHRCFLMSSVRVDSDHVEWTVAGQDSATVHSLRRDLRSRGYRVKFVASGRIGDDMALTPTEDRYVRVAYEMGYYNIPRRSDLSEISDYLGCSKSTLNVALRTAERKLVCHYLECTDGSSSENGH